MHGSDLHELSEKLTHANIVTTVEHQLKGVHVTM